MGQMKNIKLHIVTDIKTSESTTSLTNHKTFKMANATETPAAAAPVDEKKVEKEPEKEPETTAPEAPELEKEENGNGHAEECNGDAEESNGHTEDDNEDKTDANEKADAVEGKEDNPLKRKETPLDAEDDCLKKQKVVDADEKEADNAAAVEA